jgi:hypothetical protein
MDYADITERLSRLEDKVSSIKEETAVNKEVISTAHRDMIRLTESIDQLSLSLGAVDKLVMEKLSFGQGFVAAIATFASLAGAAIAWFMAHTFGK